MLLRHPSRELEECAPSGRLLQGIWRLFQAIAQATWADQAWEASALLPHVPSAYPINYERVAEPDHVQERGRLGKSSEAGEDVMEHLGKRNIP